MRLCLEYIILDIQKRIHRKIIWGVDNMGHINKKLLIARILKKIFIHKPIILVSDRKNKAGDNGEVFFKYLQNKKNIISFFELENDCEDFERIKKFGKVVSIDSKLHGCLLLFADAYVSSQIEWYPKRQSEIPYIFLQHGIADRDISDYVRAHFEHREKGYILCSTNKEYNSFCNKPYSFKEEHVWLTGLPRFDELKDNKEKIVIISLTWRADLKECNDVSDFKKSDYYKNIDYFLNSEIIKNSLEKNGYKLYIKMHPEMDKFENAIEYPSHVKKWTQSYKELFSKCSLLITDYSSICYDFAYLNKPVIFYQSKECGEGKHVWKMGDFSYEEEGVGEVVYDNAQLEKLVAEYIENDCKLKEKYQERINNLFAYHDKSNCERVYHNILDVI